MNWATSLARKLMQLSDETIFPLIFKTLDSMNKLLLSLLSAAALGLPLTSVAQQAPAMPAAPVAQPEQATAPAVTHTESATAKKAKKAKKKKLKKKKTKKAKAH